MVMCVHVYALITLNHISQVTPFLDKHGLWPCMVAPTKIIAGLGLSLGIDILDAPGATGDYRTLLTSKASAIAKALSAPLQSCPKVFVPGEDDFKAGRSDGYDFGFLHIKVINLLLLFLLSAFTFQQFSSRIPLYMWGVLYHLFAAMQKLSVNCN